MKAILLTGASVLALGIAPLVAQEQPASRSDQPHAPSIGSQANDRGAGERRIERGVVQSGPERNEDPVRDAMGDPPVQPGASPETAESDPWNRGMPFPPQDVSDNDLEPHGRDYPTAPPGPGPLAETDDWADDDSEESASFQEGEQVPEDIERFQNDDVWDGDDAWAANEDRVPSSRAERRNPDRGNQRLSSERGSSRGWDGRGESRQLDRGELLPDGSETGAVEDRNRERGEQRQDARGERREMRQEAREERRLNMARSALRTARSVVPDARFDRYNFEVENGRRVIEIAGTDPENGKRVEVDVYPNGRVHSISQVVDLGDVPESVRSVVRGELGRFRVAQSLRTLQRDLDLYYEFAGYASSGRPAVVEIRADGRDLSVRYLDQG